MNEDFVTYELAVGLKEKGFDYKCHYCYKNSIIMSQCSEPLNHNADAVIYSAPTISQVLKWLREKKKIHIIVEVSYSGWYYTLYPNVRWKNNQLISDKYIMSFKHKVSWEQAALSGIEYVLDNLI